MMKIEDVFYMKPPKYDSYRTIKIGDTLEKELKWLINDRRKDQMKYGGNF